MCVCMPKVPLPPAYASVVATAPNLAEVVICQNHIATWGAELAALRPDVTILFSI